MNQSELAERVGVSRQYINKLVLDGKITVTDGHVDLEEAAFEFDIPKKILEKNIEEMTAAELRGLRDSISSPDQQEPNPNEMYRDARARKTNAEASKKELELREARGELIEAEQVKRDAAHCAKQLQSSILNVPDRVAAQLAAESDYTEVHRILSEALRTALSSVSVGLRREED